MPAAAIMGWARAVGISGAAGGAATKQLDFITCGISKEGVQINPQGIRGSRSHVAEAVSDGPYTVGGPLSLIPRPDDLDDLLPWIMGNTGDFSSATEVGDTLSDRDVDIDWGGIGVPRAVGCRINTASFSSQAGGNLQLDMDVQGKTWTMNAAASFPAISGTLSNLQPYVHHQGTFTLGGTAMPANSINITVNNNLILDRFNASQTRTELPSQDLTISVDVDLPFETDTDALYDLAVAGVTGSIVYTNGSRSLTLAFANLKAPAQAIQIARNSEMTTRIPFTAYRTSSTACLIITNDQTG